MGDKRMERGGYSAHIIPQESGGFRIEIPVSAWTLVGEALEENVSREVDNMLEFVVVHFGLVPRRVIKRCNNRGLNVPEWFLKEFKHL